MLLLIAFVVFFVVPFVTMTTLFATSGAKPLEGGSWLKHGHQNRYNRTNYVGESYE